MDKDTAERAHASVAQIGKDIAQQGSDFIKLMSEEKPAAKRSYEQKRIEARYHFIEAHAKYSKRNERIIYAAYIVNLLSDTTFEESEVRGWVADLD